MSAPAPLSTTLVMSPEQYQQVQRETGALELAQAYAIVGTPEEQAVIAQEANSELKSVKVRIEQIEKAREGFLAPARQIIEHATNLFTPGLNALKSAESYLKGQLIDYKAREDKRIADERHAQQERERVARQKAEQEAAAARAKADAEAREKARQAAEQEAKRLEAERTGNAKAAREAAAAKAKLDEQARQAEENGEAKAQAALLAASAAVQEPAVETQKLAGFSTRENWVGEILPGVTPSDALRQIIIQIVAGRSDLMALITLDEKAINKLAKALKSNMNVPGYRAVNKPTAASRG